MNKSPQYNKQQTEPKQCKPEDEELNKPGLETRYGMHMQHLYLKINSGFCNRENFSEETLYI